MATTAEAGMLAGSNVKTGTGTNTVTFTMPAAPLYVVQSVVAHVDNTGGGDTTATLTYADSNGEVIAKKPQTDTIPAGDTGTATFALRLADDGGGIRFNRENTGGFLHVTATADVDFECHTFFAIASGVGARVDIESASTLKLVGTDSITVTSSGDWLFDADRVIAVADTSYDQQVGAGGWTTESDGDMTLDASGGAGDVFVRLRAGGTLEVLDSAQNTIFRVNEDGSLQGKTGKALVFNL